MPSPGLMFVTSKVLDPGKTSDETYNRFYNNEHLPDVLKSGNTNLALRYKNIDPQAEAPYIALYPLEDAQFLLSPDHMHLVESTRKSKTFDGDDIYNYIDFGLRPYEKIQTFEGHGHADRSGNERGQTIVAVAMEPAEGEEMDLEDWYRKQHLDMLAMCKGYRRTTRYKRLDGQEPRYLALHEYACEPDDLPAEQIKQVRETEWSRKVVDGAKIFDRDVFVLIQAQGETAEKL